MPGRFDSPVGLRRWHQQQGTAQLIQQEGYEMSLLEGCDNAYRFTAIAGAGKLPRLFKAFARHLPEEAFFILEYYSEDASQTRPSNPDERPVPEVFYSPYLPTGEILALLAPYLERLVHDGFVGFGLANNREGLEMFYSEEKVLTFFTDNHLRLSDFLSGHGIGFNPDLVLPADFGHDHLSLLGFPRHLLPSNLAGLSNEDLDSLSFCRQLVEQLDMYPVEEGLSFFLTRKEQDLIAELLAKQTQFDDFASVEFGTLLLDWSDFVTECENSFEGDLWEYRQVLKVRDTIQFVIETAPAELAEKIVKIVAEPDASFQAILTDRRKRLDPPSQPQLHQERFWYHGVILNQGTILRRDLIRHGWFHP